MKQLIEKLKELMPDIEISDQFADKLQESVQLTVAELVERKVTEIEAEKAAEIAKLTEQANAYAEYVIEETTNKVDEYCSFVVEQFIEENKQKLVEHEDYVRTVGALKSIKESFEKNYFTLNTDAVIDSLKEEQAKDKELYGKLFEANQELKKEMSALKESVEADKRKNLIESLVSSLADTQKEKIRKLVEGSSFSSLETMAEGVKLMINELNLNKNQDVKEAKEEKSIDERVKRFLPSGKSVF